MTPGPGTGHVTTRVGHGNRARPEDEAGLDEKYLVASGT
jgi:hypothetical protein